MLGNGDPFHNWLDAFCAAQEAKNPEPLADLFSQDVKLFEGPFTSPIEGRDAVKAHFVRFWERHDRSELAFAGIAKGWARWKEAGAISALDEPYRIDAIFQTELNSDGLCTRLTFWTETLSVREADMLSQRDA